MDSITTTTTTSSSTITSSSQDPMVLQIIQALDALSSSDKQTQKKANQFLEDFQKTKQAWATSISILNSSLQGQQYSSNPIPSARTTTIATITTAKIFAAQTLRQKIQLDLVQLDQQTKESLKLTLIHYLQHHHQNPKPLNTQLALCLVDLAIQFPEWVNASLEWIQLFTSTSHADLNFISSSSDVVPSSSITSTTASIAITTNTTANTKSRESNILILLELLTLLPEEIMHNYLIPIEREQLIARSDTLLADTSNHVFQLILNLLDDNVRHTSVNTNDHDSNKLVSVLVCLSSWLKSGDIKIDLITPTPIIPFIFRTMMQSNELFDVCVEMICEIIARSGGDLKRSQDHQDIISQIYTGLIALLPLVSSLSSSSVANGVALRESNAHHGLHYNNHHDIDDDAVDLNEDSEKLKGLCRIVVEAGESYCSLLLENFSQFQGIIEAILQFAAVKDLEIVKITFNFWYIICQDICSEYKQWKPVWKPVYQRLLDIMIKHLRYPDDLNDWTLAERDEFRDFRHDIGDVLKNCVRVLGEEEALSKPLILLQSVSNSQGTSILAHTPWQDIEAILFSLRTMGALISNRESRVLPQIMKLLDDLPNHPKLKYAAILVIGRYAEWTKHHPEFLTPQLNFISNGFEDVESSSAAALALKHLCESCGALLVTHLNQLHPFYHQVIERISEHDRSLVTEALAHVIDAVAWQELLPILQGFCTPIVEKLNTLSCSPISTVQGYPIHGPQDASTNTDMMNTNYQHGGVGSSVNDDDEQKIVVIQEHLSRLSVFLKHIHPGNVPHDSIHPSVLFFQEMWVVFDQLLTNMGHISRIAESFSRVTRSLFHSVGPHAKPLLPVLLNKAGILFDQHGHATYLWIATQCIKEFEDCEAHEALYQFVESMTKVTFRILQQQPRHDGNEQQQPGQGQPLSSTTARLNVVADIIDDFFVLVNSLMKQTPILFLKLGSASGMIGSILQAAVECLQIEDLHALLSVLLFLENFFGLMKLNDNLDDCGRHRHAGVVVGGTGNHDDVEFCKLKFLEWSNQYWMVVFDAILKGILIQFPRDRELMKSCCYVWMNMISKGPIPSSSSILQPQPPMSHHAEQHQQQDGQDINLNRFTSLMNRLKDNLQDIPEEIVTRTEKQQFLVKVHDALPLGEVKKLCASIQDFSSCFRRRNLVLTRQQSKK